MQMDGQQPVGLSCWRVVEGAYSCHPELGNYMDLRVFCDVDPEQQLQRIRERNGEEMASVFQAVWIPMEERYLNAYRIRDTAHIAMD